MRRPIFFLYILAFYILFQFCWWAYLLVSLNDEVYQHKIENVSLQNFPPEQKIIFVNALEKKIHQRRWMVLGEGMVFISLLSWGIISMMRAYRKEVALSRQQRNFLLSITHEFKSPLASIKLYLETLLRHDLDKEKKNSFITSAIQDTERLDTLVENSLMANLIDYKGYSFSKEDINLSALIRLIIQKFQKSPDHGKIDSNIEEGLYVHADKNALSILMINLLENALKYSNGEKYLEVKLQKADKKIALCISDHGIGIPDGEKQNIFNKFYRIGNEETRSTRGTGLGLFIVKHIIEEHSGKISVHNNIPKGTIFKVELPLLN